jgi:hypothetical protein
MAINSIKPTDQNGVGHLAFDGTTTLSDLSVYAESNNLRLGTDVINADDGKVYIMNSSYVFKEI